MAKSDPEIRKVKQLICLMDAESADVRQKVRDELLGFGDNLEKIMAQHQDQWQPEQLFWLHDLIGQLRRGHVRQDWLHWLDHQDPFRQLETGFSTLAHLQSEIDISAPLPFLLDELCDRFLAIEANPSAKSLNRFLFKDGRLKGATQDYYHPGHSHLPNVIVNGYGLPLSLVVIFILVGYRLDLEISGFNLPGHFLARTGQQEPIQVFDCFNKGKVLQQHEIFTLAISPQIAFQDLLDNPPSPAEIVMRALMNLIHAYRHAGQHQLFLFMQDLLSDLYQHLSLTKPPPNAGATESPRLACGQLVRHKRYGYRGVVVDFDLTCQAAEAWYKGNITRPNKNQPWYHILVDQAESTTYAAQSNLVPEKSPVEISHPLIPIYFKKFQDGQYQRNQVPWKLELP